MRSSTTTYRYAQTVGRCMSDQDTDQDCNKLDNLKSWQHILMLTDYGLYPVIHEPLGGFPQEVTQEDYDRAFEKLPVDRAIIEIRVS